MAPGAANVGGNSCPAGPGIILRSGLKLTVPASNTMFPLASRFPVLAECDAKVSLAEKFRPNSAATLVSEGGGPKYDRGTEVPMEAGAGNKLHPGPGPIGPGPGP